jgi:branched-chain amino acid transport system ATP-binding protein
MLALEVHQLTAGYGPLRVLHGIDLELREGERVGLVGLNGHGKTTLLRAIVGLVDWRQGEIRFQGRTVSKAATHSLARSGLVMVPQGDSLFSGLTVRENLDTGAFSSRNWRTRAHRRDMVIDLFPRLGARLNQLAGTLSGGERRMVSVGRALMADADVYLVDEPSLGLAPGIAEALIDTLINLELRKGAMLIAEQNRTLVAGKLDRVLRLHGGEIVGSDNGQTVSDLTTDDLEFRADREDAS